MDQIQIAEESERLHNIREKLEGAEAITDELEKIISKRDDLEERLRLTEAEIQTLIKEREKALKELDSAKAYRGEMK